MGKRETHLRELSSGLGVMLELIAQGHYLDSEAGFPGDHSETDYKLYTLPGVRVFGWNASCFLYWVGLHELGHHACKHDSFSDYVKNCLEREAEAWEWAVKQAREKPSRYLVERQKDHMLGYYVQLYPHTGGKSFSRMASYFNLER